MSGQGKEHPSAHVELGLQESRSAESGAFEDWCERVQAVFGFDSLDGDQYLDGYSLDTALELFDGGIEAHRAALAFLRAIEFQFLSRARDYGANIVTSLSLQSRIEGLKAWFTTEDLLSMIERPSWDSPPHDAATETGMYDAW